MKNVIKFMAICLSIAVVSACGGGGGGSVATIPQPKYPGIFLAGDSLTSNDYWDVVIRKYFYPTVWVMAAVPGTTSTQILASYDKAIKPMVVSGGVFLGTMGSNDMYAPGFDNTQTLNNMHEIWRKARADGLKVVAFTLNINDASCSCKVRLKDLNDHIRADRGLYDVLIDVEKLLPDPNDKTYYFDFVHWTEKGATVVSEAIVTALN